MICSHRIRQPIIISISPPIGSTGMRKRLPKLIPMMYPIKESTEEVIPMIRMGYRIDEKVFNPMQVNDIPTARASILVATANVSITINLAGLK